jgi:hypothetical protein
MTVRQLPLEVVTFARYLRDLTALLDPGGGWYGVFLNRDPDGLGACFDGAEIPPWDVVESLLQDFAAGRDAQLMAAEVERARRLFSASARVYDQRPGGADVLAERLRLMLGEQAYAESRAKELFRLLRTATAGTAQERQLIHDLAWVRDDLARATARCSELHARIEALPVPTPIPAPVPAPARATTAARPVASEGWFRADEPSVFETPDTRPGTDDATREDQYHAGAEAVSDAGGGAGHAAPEGPGWTAGRRRAGEPAPGYATDTYPQDDADADAQAVPEAVAASVPAERAERRDGKRRHGSGGTRKPRGARFAGLEVDESDESQEAMPVLSTPPPALLVAPRGARFGAVPATAPRKAPPGFGPEDRQAVAVIVAELRRLRAEGRSGEAHVVLCEAAERPPDQLPLLAAELHRAGLGADWSELLWEAAFLPPDRLAAAADVLAVAGRDDDCGQLLRQGVSRPAEEITDAVLALGKAGRAHEAKALLSAFVQTHTPADAALIAAADPRRLVPQLIDAARAVSGARERDLVHALRVAGLVAV